MSKLKTFIYNHKHAWTLLYTFIYMPWFLTLEYIYPADYPGLNIIHSPLDDMIPFNEWFIIPYLLWFLYVPAVFLLILFTSKKEFYRMSAYAFTGMTIALIICTIYPNGVNLRLEAITRDNILVDLTKLLHRTDTSTNVFPSLHCFVTCACHISLVKNEFLKKFNWRKYVVAASAILSILILMSTVFLNQHSILDSIAGVAMAIILYFIAYKWWFREK